MRVAVIVPNREMPDESIRQRQAFLMEHAAPGTEVSMFRMEKGPVTIESSLEHELAGYQMAEKIRSLGEDGFDAFISWCGEDAGVFSGREVASVPVVGPFKASCAMAIQLGHKFSVIGPTVQRAFMEQRVWGLGLGARLASVRSLGLSVLEAQRARDRVRDLLERECRMAAEQDGADVIVLACMALYGMAGTLQAASQIPVIDPALAALKTAETMVALGVSHSKRAYPSPREAR
jgi:allantoin racemase